MTGRPVGALDGHSASLDGLRGSAVAAIFVYHSGLGARGGFLAVSQFFTLSGFLITAIILRSRLHEQPHRLLPFWARRWRRLFPASALTLLGVVAFGLTAATQQQLERLPAQLIGALVGLINWQLYFSETSYVELFQEPSPLLHYWSLAIEEQFYLLLPVVMVLLAKCTRSLTTTMWVLGGLALASAAWTWWLFDDGASVDRLYYGTDTRAAELLVGVTMAVAWHRRPWSTGARGRRWLGAAALAAAAAVVFAYGAVSVSDPRLYHGGLLGFSILSVILVAASVQRAGPVSWLLALPPVVALGRISYGAYLFHWPIMLWLDEDTVGLAGWPLLLAVQVPITIAAATASYRYLEQPIRQRRGWGSQRFLVGVAASVGIVVLGATAVVAREVETDLAGLGEEAGEAPVVDATAPIATLVVHDAAGAPAVKSLLEAAGDDVEVVEVIACSSDALCSDWGHLQRALAEHQPDAVVLHMSSWVLGGEAQPERLGAALVDDDTVLLWAVSPADIAESVRRRRDPFMVSMTAMTSSDPRMRRLGVRVDGHDLRRDVATFGRSHAARATRVLVVGDSVSRTLGYGLERWAASTGEYLVWSAGVEGCGILNDGAVVDATGREVPLGPICDAVEMGWTEQVRQFDPDIVVVASTVADFRTRRVDGWDTPFRPGDPTFDSYLVEHYVRAVDVLGASGARVVWVTPPCAVDVFGVVAEHDGSSAVDRARLDHVRESILPELLNRRPAVGLFDLETRLCPTGEFESTVDGVADVRPDGVHFSPAGALWFAETHGDDLLAGRS